MFYKKEFEFMYTVNNQLDVMLSSLQFNRMFEPQAQLYKK